MSEYCGKHGYLTGAGDVEGIADRVIALARDESLRASMGGQGHLLARRECSLEEQRRRLESFYDSL